MVKTLKPQWRKTPKPGAKTKLGIEDRVLVTGVLARVSHLLSCRQQLGHQRIECLPHRALGGSPLDRFRVLPLTGKKRLVQGFGRLAVVVIDVTETPIERPKQRQRAFYLGKKNGIRSNAKSY